MSAGLSDGEYLSDRSEKSDNSSVELKSQNKSRKGSKIENFIFPHKKLKPIL